MAPGRDKCGNSNFKVVHMFFFCFGIIILHIGFYVFTHFPPASAKWCCDLKTVVRYVFHNSKTDESVILEMIPEKVFSSPQIAKNGCSRRLFHNLHSVRHLVNELNSKLTKPNTNERASTNAKKRER